MTTTSEILELVKRLRDYDNCHDGDVDQAADVLEEMLRCVSDLSTDCHYLELSEREHFDACQAIADIFGLGGTWQLEELVQRVQQTTRLTTESRE
jgi:hypothetical protein